MDIFSREKRSAIMSQVRSRGNRATELRLVSLFGSLGIKGWRRHSPVSLTRVAGTRLPPKVRPDFVFRRDHIAVFVDGCFWHGCPEHGVVPASSTEHWRAKINANIARDQRVRAALTDRGWTVIQIWGHELATSRNRTHLEKRLRALWP